MIIKTPEFDAELKRDILEITINKNRPLVLKGSYKIKPMGSVITDIDWTAFVTLNPKLLEIVANIIDKTKRGKKFFFIHLTCGDFKEIQVPWIINDEGCQFNLDLAYEWFEQFKKSKLVPPETIEYIKKKLFQKELNIVDLIDIERILHPFISIKWKEDDIRRGYIKHGNNTYNLLDIMKTRRAVMKYIYLYKDYEFVPMDVGLNDKNYPEEPPPESPMYYREDCYKILKSFKWKLTPDDRKIYFEIMGQVERLIAVKYEIDSLKKIIAGKVFPQNVIDQIDSKISSELKQLGISSQGKNLAKLDLMIFDKVNDYLCKYIRYFLLKIPPNERGKYERYFEREIEAQIPTSKELLVERSRQGIKCPFFGSDKDINPLVLLAIRLGMQPEKVIGCFQEMAGKYKMPMTDVMNAVIGANNLHLVEFGNQVILYDGENQVETFPSKDIEKVQARILSENRPVYPRVDRTAACNV